jgi:peptidoglycan/xylan/chitin deacetylase (PgdA/CDA1 family)
MSWIKKVSRVTIVLFIFAMAGFLYWLYGQYTVPIMMYHNVDDADEFRANTVSPRHFEQQMAYLKAHGFRVLSLDELVQLTKSRKSLPRKSAVITFDDGYADNYEHAYRILKKYGYPAIIFVLADLMNTDGYLTWEQLKKMVNNGIMVGSHTRRHSYLPDLSPAEQRDEIFGSKRIIEQNLSVPTDYFSYPIGGFNQEIKQLVKEAGYQGAVTTNRGNDRLNKDVFELKRIRFGDRDNRNDYLWIKLSGYYNLFRKAKDPY